MADKVLVTGGTGFIGGWCIVELLRRGYEVRTTVRHRDREESLRSAIASAAGSADGLTVAVADLNRDEGWDAAVAGCKYVLHVASPLGLEGPGNPDTLLIPARDGTLRVLGAALRAGVTRVVMTSAATTATPPLASGRQSLSDETVWFDPTEPSVDAYRWSKRQAERAAWDFMTSNRGATMSLTTILPGAVLGPLLNADAMGSVQVIGRLLQGRVAANPRLGFEIVDVRDLADLHVRAMTAEAAGGQRFLGVGEFMWMADISRTLRAQLGDLARKVPTRTLPDFVLKLAAIRDRSLRSMVPRLGREHRHTSAKAERVLGWQQRPTTATIVDCARSLLDLHVA